MSTLDAEEQLQGGMGRLAASVYAYGPAQRRRAYALAGQGLVSLAGFVTAIAAARVLPPAEFGLCVLGFSLLLVFVNIQNALIDTPYSVPSPRLERDGRARLAGSVAGALATQLFPWLLVAVQDSAAAGIFGACIAPLLFLTPFLLGTAKLFCPDTTHAYAEEGVAGLERTVLQSTYAVGAVMTLFCVVMAVAGGDIVILLFGQTYAGQGATVALLALGLFVSSLTLPAQHGLRALNRPNAGFTSHILALVVALSLGVWLASKHGVTGAAIAYLAAGIASSLYRYAAYARELKKAQPEPARTTTPRLMGL